MHTQNKQASTERLWPVTLTHFVIPLVLFLLAPFATGQAEDKTLRRFIGRGNDTFTIEQAKADKSKLTEEQLDDAMRDPHVCVAMQASWERVRRDGITFRDVRPNVAVPLDRASTGSFTGFAQARLPFKIPKWWSDEVHRCQHVEVIDLGGDNKQGWNFRFPLERGRLPYVAVEDDKDDSLLAYVHNYRDIHKDYTKRTVTFHGDPTVVFPWSSMIDEVHDADADPLPWTLSPKVYSIDGDRLFFSDGFEYDVSGTPLQCYSILEKKRKWERFVLAGAPPKYKSNIASEYHIYDLIPDGDELYVIGIHTFAAYLECLDVASGECKWRFSTAY